MKKKPNIFELPPKCPALANKISGIFGWRHTYQVHQRQKGIAHCQQQLCKSYSLNLPRKVGETTTTGTGNVESQDKNIASTSTRIVYPDNSKNSRVSKSDTATCEINPDSWVVVHHLQSQSGILDPSDHICDVADDREEIIAHYEDAGVALDPGVQQGGGDGASGSSVGTGSPDIFQTAASGKKSTIVAVGRTVGDPALESIIGVNVSITEGTGNTDNAALNMSIGGPGGAHDQGNPTSGVASCIEVFANEPAPLGLGLQVRRGSEPSLHQIGVTEQHSPLYNVNSNSHHEGTSKRWSAAPVCRSDSDPPSDRMHSSQQNGAATVYNYNHHLMSPEWNVPEEDVSQQHDSLLPQAFNRSGRLSMQFLGTDSGNGYRWMDAAEKVASAAHNQSESSYGYQPYQSFVHQQLQQHPFHHSGNDVTCSGGGSVAGNSSFSSKSLPRESTRKEPLGQAKASVYDSIRNKDSEMLLVVNESGGPLGLTAIPDMDRGGLLVQSVESGSRAERGRLRRGDRILEINNIKLIGLSESSVQEHLKKSLASTELRLRVVRGTGSRTAVRKAEQQHFGTRLVKSSSGPRYNRDNRVGQMIEAEEKPISTAKVATLSPTRKIPGAPSTATSLQAANTRKLGKRIEITLTKGDHGLGFSVTTRDNPAGGHCPIYIKNILPKGAAVEDGRLKPGDRLLEVEGVPMTGKSQTEVVSILRGTPQGATLKIVVSRQQELAVDVKEREIDFNTESEPKNSPPKPPPPVMPKSSLKHLDSSHSLSRPSDILHVEGVRRCDPQNNVGSSRSLPKLSPMDSSSTPKTPIVQKKSLASILKSASTNHVVELMNQHQLDSNVNADGRYNSGIGNMLNEQTMSNNGSGGDSVVGTAWKNREMLTLHIPVHDTEKAGLGVSVKGKTGSGNCSSSTGSGSSSRTDGDLGIFVKSVLHGGAASRDGRLKMNDQLLSVNGVSLLGQSNAEAMDTLRRAMLQSGGSYPGKIILKIARRIGRPVSTGELLETIDPRSNVGVKTEEQQSDANSGTVTIYLSTENAQHQQYSPTRRSQKDSCEPQNQQGHLQQGKRYSNPVLDRLTGGGTNSSTTLLQHMNQLPLNGSDTSSGGHYPNNSNKVLSPNISNTMHNHHQDSLNQRPPAQRLYAPASALVHRPPVQHGLRNESYYMATKDHWSTTSSATSLNGSNVVMIEEDPEPTSPTFHLTRPLEEGSTGVGISTGGGLSNVNTSTPNGVDPTYASQLSLETNPPSSDAFSRDAIGRRSMSEKHHAAMDARETGTYQRNKKLREKRDRNSKIVTSSGISTVDDSMESIDLQMARLTGQKNSISESSVGGKCIMSTTAALAAHLLHAEAQDQLGDLGPSLGMKKSSSLESLQTMVQEIQMADEPRGPNALRTPRGRGREEILRAVVEQPSESPAKKHWLLEDGAPALLATAECTDGGFVSRNSPFQSSLNDGKGAKLRAKKSGGLLRGIGHMFRFGKHRKDVIAPTGTTSLLSATSTEPAVDYTGPTGASHHTIGTKMTESDGTGTATTQRTGGSSSSSKRGTLGIGHSAASRYIVFDPNSVERSASSGVMYGHSQPPHYQPPPPPPLTGGATAAASVGGTSIHHTDVFNHRYSHYVNYEELQQQISRRHHLYHSQRSARNTPPVMDITLPVQQQQLEQQHQPSNVGHQAGLINQNHPPHKYKNTRPVSSYLDGGACYETIISDHRPNGSSSHRSEPSSGTASNSSHTLLTISSINNSGIKNNSAVLHNDVHECGGDIVADWHRLPDSSSDKGGYAESGANSVGSIRNLRGPFVTQVKIQNNFSFQ